jgi:hypothetical protein
MQKLATARQVGKQPKGEPLDAVGHAFAHVRPRRVLGAQIGQFPSQQQKAPTTRGLMGERATRIGLANPSAGEFAPVRLLEAGLLPFVANLPRDT